MQFTYDSYKSLLESLQQNGYEYASYHNWESKEKCVILRHDIDYCVDKALEFAILEHEMGISSTYFVLVTSDFYNIFSLNNSEKLRRIRDLGHGIGLHFDEVQYPNYKSIDDLTESIMIERDLLSTAVDSEVQVVSMHRPSKQVLDADINIPGMINSYGSIYFKQFKYLSDSRRRWREPVEKIVDSGEYRRLHILTHAFWYNKQELSIEQSVSDFIKHANIERYEQMNHNITDLESIMPEMRENA